MAVQPQPSSSFLPPSEVSPCQSPPSLPPPVSDVFFDVPVTTAVNLPLSAAHLSASNRRSGKFDIPTDVVNNILQRLPVKFVLRFKSVCNSWHSLISSSDFIESHLKNSNSNSNSNYDFLLFPAYHRLFRIHLTKTSRYLQPCPTTSLSLPPHLEKPSRLIGTCNGLICLFTQTEDFVVCNPATRIVKQIPKRSVTRQRSFSCCTLYGFGYDSVTKDYKIVLILDTMVAIYSLKEDSWKFNKHENRLYTSFKHDNGAFLNNRLHWTQRANNHGHILSFDLHDQVWREVALPVKNDIGTGNLWVIELKVESDGCLCAVLGFFDGIVRHDVWIMKEYNEVDSWVKVCTLPQQVYSLNHIEHPLLDYITISDAVRYVETLTPLVGNCYPLQFKEDKFGD